MLAAGAKAPAVKGVPIGERRVVLVFVPERPTEEQLAGLARFADQSQALADQGAELAIVAPAPRVVPPLPFAVHAGTDGAAAGAYGLVGDVGVFAIDESGIVRNVYDAERYPNLPNPAAVTRSLRKLNDSPRPAPVSEDDWRLGPAEAPILLVEYSDYQCGHCRTLHHALEPVLAEFVGRVTLVHRHLPLRATHPLAQQAAEAAEAAGAQGRFWEMHARLFAADGALERDQLLAYAAELGVDAERVAAELDGRVYQEAVNDDFRRAVAGGIKLPPSLFINGVLYEGSRTEGELRARLAELLH